MLPAAAHATNGDPQEKSAEVDRISKPIQKFCRNCAN
jgi:hypothetical protein